MTQKQDARPAAMRGGSIIRCAWAPMRDGVRLATSVLLPPGDGPFPVVLSRTAYNRLGQFGNADALLPRGIAVAAQDCRGRYDSEGEHYPFIHEGLDGADTLAWLKAQPWCNGRIGMLGDSYLAAVQFYVAPHAGPELVVLNPRFMAADPWRCGYYRDGTMSLGLTFTWLCFECNSKKTEAALLPRYDVPALMRHVPLRTMDEAAGLAPVPAYRDMVDHWKRDDYWQRLDVKNHADAFTMPTLLTAGWYDYYPGEAFDLYHAILKRASSPQLAAQHRVLVGPWTHGINPTTTLGQINFGPEAIRENGSSFRWLETILHGRDPADALPAPIRLFIMGANIWRDEHEWPLKRTRFTDMFLRSRGAANSVLGNGELSAAPPADEPPDRFTYDPSHPVPTLGGNHSIGPYNPGLFEIAPPGPFDQRPIERRDDVLVYTSAPLDHDTEVTGPVRVHLFVASDAPDTDFVARLCDVYPDGRSINITEGILRARFRDGKWNDPTPLESGRVYEIVVEMQPTANLFKAGHRLRVQITSSGFPLWSRNHNTGHDPHTDTEFKQANQIVHHNRAYPSRIVLPIIPT